jgi:ankyrin repeat protein
MVNWLLDNGADVNARHPNNIVDACDYSRSYGGANVMVFASTLEAIELLCARGANTRYAFTQPTVASSHSQGYGDSTYELLTSDTQDGPIARCLVRHGAVVNTVYDPGEYDLDFGSYWKNVVVSGDITWAAELLAKYGANADWPSECDCDFDLSYGRYEDGDQGDDFSTVLIIAIRKQDLPMVRLLLEHGADPNKATPNFAEDSDEEDQGNPKETPLLAALKTGNAPIIELLMSKGAKGD